MDHVTLGNGYTGPECPWLRLTTASLADLRSINATARASVAIVAFVCNVHP